MKTNNKKAVGLGEVLLRLTAPSGTLIRNANNFSVNYGGSEANVIISLAHLGYSGVFISKMAEDELGQACRDYLVANGVDTSNIASSTYPMGIYFLENGEGARASKVVYDRKHSAATKMVPEDFNFDKVFENASLLHISGITLAISDTAKETALKAMEVAKKHGVKICFDFNYRTKLLPLEKAQEIYPLVAKYADIVFASPWDIKTILGFESDEKDDKKLFMDACKHFNFDYLFTKKRTIISAREQKLQAFAYTKDKEVSGSTYQFEIFDRIGAGDAFAAGILAGLLDNYADPLIAINYGIANCVLKQSIFGDASTFTKTDLKDYLLTKGTEEVKR
jgi:2-dehydro-3-deoxygluconokinase